jgi:cytidine deaminase
MPIMEITMKKNHNKELTAKATSEFDRLNPILSEKWFAEASAAFEAAAEKVKDLDYVDCSYCCNQTANPSGICTRCLKEEGQWE